MNHATRSVILDAAQGSAEGRLHFGEVVARLMQAGVESYAVDHRANRSTYYLPDGETFDVGAGAAEASVDIGQRFDAEGVRAAIRGAQQGSVMYPPFRRLTQAAGCVGYIVWLAGRRVDYFGRNGETHVEAFPSGAS